VRKAGWESLTKTAGEATEEARRRSPERHLATGSSRLHHGGVTKISGINALGVR